MAIVAVPMAARPAAAQQTQTCVEATVGNSRSYSCVNDALARLAAGAHGAGAAGVLSPQSPAPAVGTFNQTATAERMGNTFGHSVLPQRPPPPHFAFPLLTPPR